jgi:nitroreductase
MANRLLKLDPNAGASATAREAKKPLRAPLIIAVIGVIDADHAKIPEFEQVLSAGAAAQNIMLAAHALGYGCMWKTGGICYDEGIKAQLDLNKSDHIVGLMYLGTLDPDAPNPEFERPNFRDHVTEWE